MIKQATVKALTQVHESTEDQGLTINDVILLQGDGLLFCQNGELATIFYPL